MERVTAPQFLHHGAGLLTLLRLRHGHCFVYVGIERLPQRLDGAQAVALQYLAQLTIHDLNALQEAPVPVLVVGRGQGAFKVVEHLEQGRNQRLIGEEARLFQIGASAPAAILQIRPGPQELILKMPRALFHFLKPAVQGALLLSVIRLHRTALARIIIIRSWLFRWE